MTKPRQDELPQIDAKALKRADEIMRRMLNSPPQPFTPPKKKAKKRHK
jgi:hypothetical protein